MLAKYFIIFISLFSLIGHCCFLGQSGLDKNSGWPCWKAGVRVVIQLQLRGRFDIHPSLPYFTAGIMTLIRTCCLKLHLNQMTLGGLCHLLSLFLSENSDMMVLSVIHSSFCILRSWVSWEGPGRSYKMCLSLWSPHQIHRLLFASSQGSSSSW